MAEKLSSLVERTFAAMTARATAAESALAEALDRLQGERDENARLFQERADAIAALAEARGALKTAFWGERPNLPGMRIEPSTGPQGETYWVCEGPIAALARAGEQETRKERARVARERDACAACNGIGQTHICGAVEQAPLPEKQLSGSAEPASSGQEVGARIRFEPRGHTADDLRASLIGLLGYALEGLRRGYMNEYSESAFGVFGYWLPGAPAPFPDTTDGDFLFATPPPGEQGKGGGEGLREALKAAGEYIASTWSHTDYLKAKEVLGEIDRALTPAQPAEHPASGGEEKP